MKDLRLGKVLIAIVALLVVVPSVARSAPSEPDADPTFRGTRTDYVKTWHIYNDDQLDGILNPGDTKITTFENWWTPASSHSQHNYSRDGGSFTYDTDSDINSNPINYASHKSSGKEDFWMETRKNAVNFYMTYSQFDNNNWKGGYEYDSNDAEVRTVVKERHETRNGWAFGWVTHAKEPSGSVPMNPQTQAGVVDMDIFVHHGKGLDDSGVVTVNEWAGEGHTDPTKSYSNPQLSMCNDICEKAKDKAVSLPAFGAGGDRYHPLQFDDDPTKGYSWLANAPRMLYNTLDINDLNDIKDSMEIKEYDSDTVGDGNPDHGDVIWGNRRPSEIEANLFEHDGITPYVYSDAFLDDSVFHNGASDGGVIAGLAGQTIYNPDPLVNNWGDQQVIRIDFSEATLQNANIDRIVFWDFGAPGTGDQINPTAIVFGINLNQTVLDGQIFWINPGTGVRTYFPENRIYIAQVVNIIPEPASLALLAIGAVGLLIRRRRAVIQ